MLLRWFFRGGIVIMLFLYRVCGINKVSLRVYRIKGFMVIGIFERFFNNGKDESR